MLVNEIPYFGDAALRESEQLTAAILRQTARTALGHGAQPLFAVLSIGPQRPPAEHPEWSLIRELFVEQHLPHALIDLPPSELVPGDGHPDPRGHRRIADALEAALRGRMTRGE
jgi:hypothetical protein